MPGEFWKWNTVTVLIDTDTGEVLNNNALEKYDKLNVISQTTRTNNVTFTKTITRTYACRKKRAVQQTIW